MEILGPPILNEIIWSMKQRGEDLSVLLSRRVDSSLHTEILSIIGKPMTKKLHTKIRLGALSAMKKKGGGQGRHFKRRSKYLVMEPTVEVDYSAVKPDAELSGENIKIEEVKIENELEDVEQTSISN